jgi:hypothetical protein
MSPLLVPLGLSVAYLVLAGMRFGHITAWMTTYWDYGAAYVLGTAVAHGHTGGEVVLSTQGAYLSLAWAVLTHGLPFHRALWEASGALLTVVVAAVVGRSVGRLSTRGAGWLSMALILAASPDAMRVFIVPWAHNTTWFAVALLGAFLAWLHLAARSPGATVVAAVAMSLIVGVATASDHMLEPAGLAPFLLAALLVARRTRDWRGVPPVVAVVVGSAVVAELTEAIARSMHYVSGVPAVRIDVPMVPTHVEWLIGGVLRLGNGAAIGHEAWWRVPLTAAAAVVTVLALLATARLASRSLARPGTGEDRARAAFVTYWVAGIVCMSAAYVLTTAVPIPSDQYLGGVVLALAAVVPLLLRHRSATRGVVAGATIFIVAGLVGLAAGDISVFNRPVESARNADRIAAFVQRHHLGVGYAGYEESGPLDWASGMRLALHPITDAFGGHLEPMNIARVAAWYRPRPDTDSYVLLAPGDQLLTDRIPPQLPRPAHVYRVGRFTIAAWPFDIAADLSRPIGAAAARNGSS